MMLKKTVIRLSVYGLLISSLFTTNTSTFAANSISPKEVLKKKYPNEVATVLKTADINGDNKKEDFILTQSGNFYIVNYKGVITHIASDFKSDYSTEIEIYSVSNKQKLVGIKYYNIIGPEYFSSYKYSNGSLKRVLSISGDLSVMIDKNNGTISQYWKKYNPNPDVGGWDARKTSHKWDASYGIYRNVGTVSTLDFVF